MSDSPHNDAGAITWMARIPRAGDALRELFNETAEQIASDTSVPLFMGTR